jgi:hypothetical protein
VLYAGRRLLAVVAVVVLATSLAFVVLGSLQNGVTVWERLGDLPGYLSDTFLHLRLGGEVPRFQQSLTQVVLDGLPVDVALLVGGMVLGVAIGLPPGWSAARAGAAPSIAR